MRLSGKIVAASILPLASVLLLAGCKPGRKTAAEMQACMNSCLAEHNCDLSFEGNPHALGSQCLIEQNNCQTRCEGKQSSADAFSDDMRNRIPVSLPPPVNGSTTYLVKKGPYGAIAYSKQTHSWGASVSSADKASAEKSAMDFCTQQGAGCVVVDSFSNACIAVASGAKDTIIWARAWTAAAARVKAQSDCAKKTGDSCAIQFWQCYPDELAAPAQGNPKEQKE